MIPVAITQRVAILADRPERRDCLDQAWSLFLKSCGILPILLPNQPDIALELLSTIPVNGIILSGGNDLVAYGGDAPERDRTETRLIESSIKSGLPLVGVCRGMELIQHHFGIPLRKIEGHVTPRQTITIREHQVVVNSFHEWGTDQSTADFNVWGSASDGIIKAISRKTLPLHGIMWHPERMMPFRDDDIVFFRGLFQQ